MIKYVFLFIISIHGLIHLLGFVKAFELASVPQLTKEISKPVGFMWLVAGIILMTVAITYLLNFKFWWIIGGVGCIISQILIFTSWHDAKFGSIANLFLIVIVLHAYVRFNFYDHFIKDVHTYQQLETESPGVVLSEADIAHLPDPVKRYLRYYGAIGKPMVQSFKVEFTGKIRKSDQAAWMPFHSLQYNFLKNPARLFFMDAEMKQMPVSGYHCYKNEKAFMDIRLFSLARVQYMEGPDMDIAETVTFFNDMCIMAPATLIDPRISWLEVNGNEIKAAFTNRIIQITAWLYFNDKGELINFTSEDRYNFDAGKKLKWSTPIKAYKEINGYRMASSAETLYHYPHGEVVYGTFELVNISFNDHDLIDSEVNE